MARSSLAGLPSGKSSKLPPGYSGWSQARRSKYWALRRSDRKKLLDPNAPLSGQNLLGAARAEVDLALQPKISALDTQARSARIQGGALASRAGGYYHDLAGEAANEVARIQATKAATNQSLAAITQQGQSAADHAASAAAAAQEQDTGIRGPGLSGGGDQRVQEELAAQRARSAEIGQAAQAQGENIGSNWEGLARQTALAGQLHGGEVQSQIVNKLANELSDIRTQKAQVQSLRGEELTSNLMKLRQTAFENSATASTLGQKKLALEYQKEAQDASNALAQQRINVTSSHNKAQEDVARRRIDVSLSGQRTTRRGQNLSHADRVAARKQRAAEKKAGGPGAKELAASKKFKGQVESARQRIATLLNTPITQGPKKGQKPTWADIQPYLRQEGYSPLQYAAAFDMHRYGFLEPATVRRLRTAGVMVPPGWTRRTTGFGLH